MTQFKFSNGDQIQHKAASTPKMVVTEIDIKKAVITARYWNKIDYQFQEIILNDFEVKLSRRAPEETKEYKIGEIVRPSTGENIDLVVLENKHPNYYCRYWNQLTCKFTEEDFYAFELKKKGPSAVRNVSVY